MNFFGLLLIREQRIVHGNVIQKPSFEGESIGIGPELEGRKEAILGKLFLEIFNPLVIVDCRV